MYQAGIELFTRRQLFLRGAAAAVSLANLPTAGWLAAHAQTVTVLATPSATEGPYFADEKLNRSDIRLDPSNNIVSTGFPLLLGVTVSRITNGVITPLNNAYVDIWHCDAAGKYSDFAVEGTAGRKFLRGYQVTDAHGNCRFLSIYPGWYSGRTVHIHCKVRLYDGAATTYTFNTQFFFEESTTDSVYLLSPYSSRPNRATRNTSDGIYNGSSGARLLLRLAKDDPPLLGEAGGCP